MTVIVPHYNDLVRLRTCLEAIELQTLSRERFEIVVADNSSPVGLAAVEAAVAGRARVTVAGERGAGMARNAGVAEARGSVLAFTDSDCIPEPNWLAAGLARLANADLVGGRMTVSVGDEARMTGAEAFERVFAFHNRHYIEKKRFSVTANLFCRRSLFDAVGPFRNAEISEDFEWCRRAVAQGFSLVYEPSAVVSHPARADWLQLKRKWTRMNAETYAMTGKGKAGQLRWVARNLSMPFSILAHVPKVVASPELPDARARVRALGTLARLRLWRMVDGLRLVGRNL
ncbi:MAG: glycosyltransferase [Novosphingobium sp.]